MTIRNPLIAWCSLFVLLSAIPAFAQTPPPARRPQTPAPAPPAAAVKPPRLFIDGIGGVTFEHVAGGLVAGGVTITASKHVQIAGEVGRMSNVLPGTMARGLNTAAASLVASGTPTLTYHASIPSTYALAALRLIQHPSPSGLALFVEAGAGVAHVAGKISALSAGTDATATLVALSGPLPTATRPMVQAGAGISITLKKKSAVDLGYRYGRIFTTARAIATNRFYAALRVGI